MTDSAIADPHQAEVGQITAGLERMLELDRLVRRQRVGLQADQLDGGQALGVGRDDRGVEGQLGGVEVLLDVDRRDVQGRADVVEAEADLVGGEGVGEVEVEAEQVADRVVVLLTVEPTDHDRRRSRSRRRNWAAR